MELLLCVAGADQAEAAGTAPGRAPPAPLLPRRAPARAALLAFRVKEVLLPLLRLLYTLFNLARTQARQLGEQLVQLCSILRCALGKGRLRGCGVAAAAAGCWDRAASASGAIRRGAG